MKWVYVYEEHGYDSQNHLREELGQMVCAVGRHRWGDMWDKSEVQMCAKCQTLRYPIVLGDSWKKTGHEDLVKGLMVGQPNTVFLI